MAQRRMTSLDVIDTDAFLDMSASAQLLYFHLNARADDDGFVASPKKIARSIGSQGDDIKLLIAKKFVIPFEDGVCVIKHWRINNFVRKDIYKETKYINHKSTLFIRSNGAYTLTDDGKSTPVPIGHFKLEDIENNHVNVASTKRQLRLGKVRLGKDSIGKVRKTKTSLSSLSFLEKLPTKTVDELSEKYYISPKGIQGKATDLLLYCKQKGKVYKDYKAFLENALRKDKQKLQTEYPLVKKVEPTEDIKLTPEQIEKNKEIRQNISNMLKSKQKI